MNSYEEKIESVIQARNLLFKLASLEKSQHVLDLTLIALESLSRLIPVLSNLQKESEEK